MKYFQFLTLVIFTVLMACNNSPDRPEPMLDPAYEPTTTPTNSNPVSAGSVTPSTGGTVYHYICPNNCGGGDSAGTCPVCGATYTHNQAFHNQTNAATTTTTTPDLGANNAANVTTSSTQTPEPAQNAAGVWHYTCSNGCAGGAGSAIACATCGATLAHNSLYHQ